MRLVHQAQPSHVSSPWSLGRDGWRWLLARPAYVTALVLGLGFLLAPWPVSLKVHAFLHGLCAQRVTHSFFLGGQALPFDARMTGIYGGFLITMAYLVAMGRARAWALPGRGVLALLAAFVLAMAIDGTNSTLRDFGLWHAYQPDNRLRLATGLLTGIALAAALCHILATTLWNRGDWRTATIRNASEVGLLVMMTAPFALLVVSDLGILFTPLSLLLVLAAIGVVVAMAIALLTMARRRDQMYGTLGELQRPLAISLVLAVVVIGALAGGRFVLEWWLAIPPMI